MQALVIVLNKVEYLESTLKVLKDSGIRGATIIDGLGSRSSSNNLLNTKSFLASIVQSLEQSTEVKKVIFSVVEKDKQVEKAVGEINKLVNNSHEKESGAFMFTLPVNYMRGGELERHINRRESKINGKG